MLWGANIVQMLAFFFFFLSFLFLVGSNFPEIDATKAPFCLHAKIYPCGGMPYQVDPIPIVPPPPCLP